MRKLIALTPLFIALLPTACESSPEETDRPLGASGEAGETGEAGEAGEAPAGTAGNAGSPAGGGSTEPSPQQEGGAGASAGASGAPDGSGEAGAGTGGQGPNASAVAIVPQDGWVDASSNALGVQGAAYGAADSVTAKTLVSDVKGNRLCMSGAAARIDLQCTPAPPATDCYQQLWGARLQVNLNQSSPQAQPLPYDASAFSAFRFDLVGPNVPANVRFSVETSDGGVYCVRPPSGGVSASWEVGVEELVPQCHQPEPNGPNASSKKPYFTALHWTVIGTTRATVPFDFCVENLRIETE